MKPLINLISRVFLALALCVSAPAAFAGDSSYDIDKERVAQEIREKAMSGDLDGASEAVETYEDSPLAAAKLLIATGGDVNAKDGGGYTPLHWAAYNNAARAAQLLLENGAKIIPSASVYGYTPLHYAVGWRFPEVAKVLLDYGADVEARPTAGWYTGMTPLILAINAAYPSNSAAPHPLGIERGDEEEFFQVLNLLIDNGADVNAEIWHPDRTLYLSGRTAMDSAGHHTGDFYVALTQALIAAGGRCNIDEELCCRRPP